MTQSYSGKIVVTTDNFFESFFLLFLHALKLTAVAAAASTLIIFLFIFSSAN